MIYTMWNNEGIFVTFKSDRIASALIEKAKWNRSLSYYFSGLIFLFQVNHLFDTHTLLPQ